MRTNELACLNIIKDSYFNNIGAKIEFDNSDYCVMRSILNGAHHNPNYNEFPDFLFDGGGIEHFELTSSKETRKGSEFKIEENKNKSINKERDERLKQDFLNSKHVPFTMMTANYEETYESFSYDDFLYSLRKNISNHVESLINNGYEDKTVVFLMEQPTARLWIDEGVIPIRFYELHKDKKALQIIKELCRSVNYIIYFVSDSIEIIDLSKIDTLLAKAVTYSNVKGGTLVKCHTNLFINL